MCVCIYCTLYEHTLFVHKERGHSEKIITIKAVEGKEDEIEGQMADGG